MVSQQTGQVVQRGFMYLERRGEDVHGINQEMSRIKRKVLRSLETVIMNKYIMGEINEKNNDVLT
jgi:hypothetical protein